MAGTSTTRGQSRCRNCGFEAPGGDEQWLRIEVPKLGRMTQCPICESTDVITSR
ncbi:hypothetical protein [Natrialba asiatica]|uniref:Small CPxCG-related zinc finger protein n=1 Tax=Natrialba asiatica (strain ATCC 700177 / DSM 12278 / JCM 9576 / FERM P-10747 / NBRC 102637 / 172P1) TaxID=29540 RepID=M0AZC5_NATA1|nr:hypothetical protein [Natrialba asiatica]ELZ02789.1 hypothetical protein C481_06282 [Natrialba asiatica DSM 12278]